MEVDERRKNLERFAEVYLKKEGIVTVATQS